MLSKLGTGSIFRHSFSLPVWVVYASESLDAALCDRVRIAAPMRILDTSAGHVLEAMGIPRREAMGIPRISMIRRFLQLSESEPRKLSNKQRNGRLQ